MLRSYAASIAILLALACLARAENWPCWRGPRGDGTSQETGLPMKWDGAAGENIVWKTAIPGRGHASPIVWEDRVFVVSCLEDSKDGVDAHDRVLVCVDRKSGTLLWQASVLKTPLEKKHNLNSFASGTPATDGKLVYTTFLEPDFGSTKERTPGNMVVSAHDFSGKLRWQVKPGRFASVHGYCSSPVIYEDLLIVNGDHDGDSYLVALDKATGKTVWKVPRANKTRSYVTPLIRTIDGRTQMVFSGSKHVASYDPRTGKELWTVDGPTEQFVASMVYDGKLLFLSAGFPTYHVMAIRPDGEGNVTKTHVAWHVTNATCYVPSPVLADKYLFVADDRGTANCFDTATGKRYWQARLGNHYSASLVAAEGLVHFLADDGTTKILRPGPKPEVVAENPLGEYCYASPAISQGQIFLRGERNLYCIGAGK
jgi:outer membrane protein assembly factor BamB